MTTLRPSELRGSADIRHAHPSDEATRLLAYARLAAFGFRVKSAGRAGTPSLRL